MYLGPGFTESVTWSYVKEHPDLLKKIVSKNIIGLRSDIEIPRKFLGYFSYSGKYNLLTVMYNHPMSLTLFLLDKWRKQKHKCFLLLPVSFKKFLRQVPTKFLPPEEIKKKPRFPYDDGYTSSYDEWDDESTGSSNDIPDYDAMYIAEQIARRARSRT
jgi:hypothetical protein